MKQVKKYTQKQQITRLMKDNQNLFNMIMQLGQEVNQIGQLTEVTLNILKQQDNYPELVEKMQAKLAEHSEQQEKERATAEQGTQETSTSDAKKEYITDDDGKGAIDYGDEHEERMDIIGQNGNTGEHYAADFAKQIEERD